MYNRGLIAITLILTVVASAAIFLRVTSVKDKYDTMVAESKKVSEGYDRAFIAMVDHLEAILAERASFPYLGGKDPMTGKKRIVARPAPKKKVKKTGEPEKKVVVDPFRLTAIIFDDIKKEYTAIMMVGERSYSIEMGDMIRGRKAERITDQYVQLNDGTVRKRYGIDGKVQTEQK